MNIRLKPELQKLVEQDVQRGPYQTPDEFVERAIVLLHEQESWLAQNASQIDAQVREGYAAAQRGEPLDAESIRHSMDEKNALGFLTSARNDSLPAHAAGTGRPLRYMELGRTG